ncbi:DENN domain-containing protein 11-like isoform X2 [Tubulanus polymorphus]|uniref:DENN domain-containing protein 11-like isoform X2 n=1 Tax=Tubulanus polymorphus TaxID=672921 RepID=UPI003DA29ADD
MAEDEKSPLLDNFESNSVEYRGNNRDNTIRHRLHNNENRTGLPGHQDGVERGTISASTSASNLTDADYIVSIFVIAFDTRTGNMVEWCLPEDADLDGVEFKAMASGSHTLHRDFVYFRKGELYGLACFENMPVESEIERGARMKSVGILATSYTLLYRHMQFLETQVRHQLEIPGKYTQLKAFYNDKKGVLASSVSTDSIHLHTPVSTPSSEILPELKITHPAGCFSQFIKFFGEQIFILWKYILLQKRILFFSPPPIGVVCYRVYCACCLGNHSVMELSGRECKPHFYVNVADIETLETEMSYIACTTEKIFECKTQLYDIYVDNQNVLAQSAALKEILRVSDSDRDKLAKLNNQRSASLFSREELGETDALDEEDVFTEFFYEQNTKLFQTLLDVSASQDRQLTGDHMKLMGLDPVGDRPFLMELVETYGIDVMLMVDNPCCPR